MTTDAESSNERRKERESSGRRNSVRFQLFASSLLEKLRRPLRRHSDVGSPRLSRPSFRNAIRSRLSSESDAKLRKRSESKRDGQSQVTTAATTNSDHEEGGVTRSPLAPSPAHSPFSRTCSSPVSLLSQSSEAGVGTYRLAEHLANAAANLERASNQNIKRVYNNDEGKPQLDRERKTAPRLASFMQARKCDCPPHAPTRRQSTETRTSLRRSETPSPAPRSIQRSATPTPVRSTLQKLTTPTSAVKRSPMPIPATSVEQESTTPTLADKRSRAPILAVQRSTTPTAVVQRSATPNPVVQRSTTPMQRSAASNPTTGAVRRSSTSTPTKDAVQRSTNPTTGAVRRSSTSTPIKHAADKSTIPTFTVERSATPVPPIQKSVSPSPALLKQRFIGVPKDSRDVFPLENCPSVSPVVSAPNDRKPQQRSRSRSPIPPQAAPSRTRPSSQSERGAGEQLSGMVVAIGDEHDGALESAPKRRGLSCPDPEVPPSNQKGTCHRDVRQSRSVQRTEVPRLDLDASVVQRNPEPNPLFDDTLGAGEAHRKALVNVEKWRMKYKIRRLDGTCEEYAYDVPAPSGVQQRKISALYQPSPKLTPSKVPLSGDTRPVPVMVDQKISPAEIVATERPRAISAATAGERSRVRHIAVVPPIQAVQLANSNEAQSAMPMPRRVVVVAGNDIYHPERRAVPRGVRDMNGGILQPQPQVMQFSRPVAAAYPKMGQVREELLVNPADISFEKRIGAGASAEVWKGQWRGSDVAVKVLYSTSFRPELNISDFQQELEIMTRVRHPNLVLLMGASTSHEPMCLVTEFCSGGDLCSLLHGSSFQPGATSQRSRVNLSWPQRLQIASDIAKGCAFLHTSTPQIIHRDLKSLNILLSSPVQFPHDPAHAKIADFGLSRLTRSGEVRTICAAGTGSWMAPELFNPGSPFCEKVDIYAFAIVLYEIVTQTLPYADMAALPVPELGRRVAAGLRPSLSKVPANCPRTLRDLMVRCWAAAPQQRPPFAEIIETLKAVSGLVAS